jgi:FkbM family methyltransferase
MLGVYDGAMSATETVTWKRAVKRVLSALPFEFTVEIARTLLASQGFGAGADVASSGETGVFELMTSPEPILFDVGGFCGEYSKAFLDRHPGGKVFLFEPSPDHFAIARKTLVDSTRATCLPIALAGEAGVRTLYANHRVSGLASLTRRKLEHMGVDMAAVTREVECERLDDIVQRLGVTHIDLLKLDVEGHELEVLRSGAKTLAARMIRCIQFEFGGANLDTRTLLKDFWMLLSPLGYRFHVVKPTGRLVPLARYSELYEQAATTNFVAVA